MVCTEELVECFVLREHILIECFFRQHMLHLLTHLDLCCRSLLRRSVVWLMYCLDVEGDMIQYATGGPAIGIGKQPGKMLSKKHNVSMAFMRATAVTEALEPGLIFAEASQVSAR